MKISIITAVFNARELLNETATNILSELTTNDQWIIIDAVSTDGSLARVRSIQDSRVLVISETDTGIYDAWNKGLRLALGTVIGFLNAGDFYRRGTLDHVRQVVDPSRRTIWIGDTILFSPQHRLLRIVRGTSRPPTAGGFGFVHTSVFTTKAIYDEVGLFSTKYRIAGDTDWLLRALALGISIKHGGWKNYMISGGVSERDIFLARNEYLEQCSLHGIPISFMSLLKTRFLDFLSWLFGKYALTAIKSQVFCVAVATLTTLINLTPFRSMKCWFLRLFGNNVSTSSTIGSRLTLFHVRNLKIGDHCVINSGVFLDARIGITMGANVNVAHGVKIYTLGHDVQCPYFSAVGKPVVLGDHVVLFAYALIMPGTELGEGCVVYPGAVVSGKHAPFSILAGVPARVVGTRSRDLRYELHHPYWYAI